MSYELIIALLAAAVHSGTPILYATLGEILTEKGGVLNLGVEGMMSVSAFAAFLAVYYTGSPWLAFFIGGCTGLTMASLHAFVTITCLGNQVVSGLALTLLGQGLTSFLGTPYIGQNAAGFNPVALPFLSDIPAIGPIFFKHNMLVYVSFFLPVLLWLFMRRTSLGMAVKAVGRCLPPHMPPGSSRDGYAIWPCWAVGSWSVWVGPIFLWPIRIFGPTVFPPGAVGSLWPWSSLPFGGQGGPWSVPIFSGASWPFSFGSRPPAPPLRRNFCSCCRMP